MRLLSQKALEIYRSVFTWSRHMVDSHETEQEERESPLRDGHDCKIRILYDNLNKKNKEYVYYYYQ